MKKIITISREFGSGGRSIGKAVAEKLNYHYYDKELIEKIAEKSGLSEEYIKEKTESSKPESSFKYAFLGPNLFHYSEDYLWKQQKEVISELAEKGNCVIMGRCADFLLKDREDCIHIYIHADLSFIVERIVNLYGETEEKPEKRLRDKDKKRAMNYKYYTDRTWGMSQNYTLSLNSGEIGIDKCVEIICDLVKNM